jgi:hypothetical protein
MERDEKLLLKFAQEKVENMNMSMNMSASNSMSNSISMSMCSMNSSNVSISNFDAVNVDVVDVDTDDGVCVQMSATTGELGKAKGSINSNSNNYSNTTNKGDNNHMEEDVDAHLTEWQDVSPEENQIKSASLLSSATSSAATAAALREKNLYDEPSPSALGIALAKCAISDMSSANIQVSTPVAALALALHSALRSDFLGFKCTGVPEEEDCFSSDLKISATTTTTTKKKSNGFAPPVRELPKGKFLPDNWDNCASLSNLNQLTSSSTSRVTLRYRKNGLGATILRVTQMVLDGDAPMNATTSTNTSPNTANNQFMARISFGPAGGEPQILDIPMNRHVNVDGLNTALSKLDKGKFKVKPALHYKSLSLLLSDFCKCSDLGSVKEIEDSSYKSTSASTSLSTRSGNSNSNNNHTDVMINVNDVNLTQTSSSNPRSRITTSYNIIPGTSTSTSTKNNNMNVNVNVNVNNIDYYQNQNRIRNEYRVSASPNIQDDLLAGGVSTNRPGGDFANDLLPSGVPSPGFADPRYGVGGPGTTGSGNLMGMNHPIFQRNNDDYNPNPGGVGNFPGVGGLGMQPRFDPYHPPGVGGGRFGVGGGRGNGRGRGRGGRGRGRGSTDYSGDPNPDHERPPNTFGTNDMFM